MENDFDSKELLPWQVMSSKILELVTKIDDMLLRLDDLERTIGEMQNLGNDPGFLALIDDDMREQEAKAETASWERFNTRHEMLPEQRGNLDYFD